MGGLKRISYAPWCTEFQKRRRISFEHIASEADDVHPSKFEWGPLTRALPMEATVLEEFPVGAVPMNGPLPMGPGVFEETVCAPPIDPVGSDGSFAIVPFQDLASCLRVPRPLSPPLVIHQIAAQANAAYLLPEVSRQHLGKSAMLSTARKASDPTEECRKEGCTAIVLFQEPKSQVSAEDSMDCD
mmetsp:Transcript_40702/g.107817  ORF Transcript_40702/g.107817 Transcript_40702/m.107817 type:complete len:186 (-) Transcript_40702:114-671(-)|eukprot:CAMPEP_0194484448 /NCGR_PEP_ID=MMETSP0253-20130528/5766_1 /TAXON_ID=2966 /ORGANISM="Noctiluca scintillans" /LENGTH=185 /DNA_ID=CAMNT_0039324261 /DNA_START=49 /DNA_END=606 /DNA_ORIENTATION=-